MYISMQKRLRDCYGIGFNLEKLYHNHAPNPDPFMYIPYCPKRLGYSEALELASDLCGVVGYFAASQVLQKKGWEINRKQFYNLLRKEDKGTLTRQDELVLILKVLKNKGLYPRVRDEYILDEDSERKQRVVRDIFWMSPEQIRMARRFASDFMYEINTTFNTNILKLLLSVIVGIDNTSSTFLLAYYYITSESAASFK